MCIDNTCAILNIEDPKISVYWIKYSVIILLVLCSNQHGVGTIVFQGKVDIFSWRIAVS